MPRKEGQKRKLLVLLEILARETDEKHPLSVPSWWKTAKPRHRSRAQKCVWRPEHPQQPARCAL